MDQPPPAAPAGLHHAGAAPSPGSMLVARLHAAHDVRPAREPAPVPLADEVLVRVTAVGLCGSDRHWYEAGGIGETALREPLILGHELAGVIADGPRAGERVAIEPADPCERCELCLAGRGNLCATTRFAGHTPTDGGLRELMAWPGRLCFPLPDTIAAHEAPLLEPLGVALYAVRLGRVAPGARTAVIGCGPLGLLIVAALREQGAGTIVAVDRLGHRVEAARAMGAHEAFVAGPEEAPPTAGRHLADLDVVFEVAGEDAAVEAALRAARPGGRVVMVGIPDDDRTTITASVARRKALELVFCRRMEPADLPRAIQLAGTGRIPLASLVTHRYPLAEAAEAFRALEDRRGLKVVVEPGGSATGGAGTGG